MWLSSLSCHSSTAPLCLARRSSVAHPLLPYRSSVYPLSNVALCRSFVVRLLLFCRVAFASLLLTRRPAGLWCRSAGCAPIRCAFVASAASLVSLCCRCAVGWRPLLICSSAVCWSLHWTDPLALDSSSPPISPPALLFPASPPLIWRPLLMLRPSWRRWRPRRPASWRAETVAPPASTS